MVTLSMTVSSQIPLQQGLRPPSSNSRIWLPNWVKSNSTTTRIKTCPCLDVIFRFFLSSQIPLQQGLRQTPSPGCPRAFAVKSNSTTTRIKTSSKFLFSNPCSPSSQIPLQQGLRRRSGPCSVYFCTSSQIPLQQGLRRS